MAILSLVLFSFLVTSQVSCSLIDSRIVGGEVAITSIPYAVSLQVTPKVHECAGSIIDTRWVLTSATCLGLEEPVKYVQPGTNNLNNIDYVFHISVLKIHPGYEEETGRNNIGMVKTLQPFTYSTTVKSIGLGSSFLNGGYQMTAFGWGTNTIEPIATSNLLRTTIYNSMTNNDCIRDIVPITYIDNGQICGLRARDKGVCVGDSGGGLIYGGRVYGVIGEVPGAENSTRECADGRPVIFTRVSFYYSWIVETMRT